MPKRRSWTDDQLIAAVQTNTSYRAVIRELGLIPAGGNYRHVELMVRKLGLSTKHFMGKGWSKGWKFDPQEDNPYFGVACEWE